MILNILVNKFLLYGNIWIYGQKAEQKTQSFNDWLNNLGKEGYKLVSEKGKLCILKRK